MRRVSFPSVPGSTVEEAYEVDHSDEVVSLSREHSLVWAEGSNQRGIPVMLVAFSQDGKTMYSVKKTTFDQVTRRFHRSVLYALDQNK